MDTDWIPIDVPPAMPAGTTNERLGQAQRRLDGSEPALTLVLIFMIGLPVSGWKNASWRSAL